MNTPSEDPSLLSNSESSAQFSEISAAGRYAVLTVAFLGWMFAGVQMSITSLAMRSAAIDVLGREGTIDLPRFNALNKELQEEGEGKQLDEVLTSYDAQALTGWRAAASTFAITQSASTAGWMPLRNQACRAKKPDGSLPCNNVVTTRTRRRSRPGTRQAIGPPSDERNVNGLSARVVGAGASRTSRRSLTLVAAIGRQARRRAVGRDTRET